MADYASPTVIQQPIPNADLTALEYLLLTNIFQADPVGDALYFYAEFGPSDLILVPAAALRAAFAASAAIASTATSYVGERIDMDTDEIEIEIDLSGTSWEFILQDIVRRSTTLRTVTAVTSFTCSKMRSDGFDGMVVLITADAIKGKSTNDILQEFIAEEEAGAGRNRREGEG